VIGPCCFEVGTEVAERFPAQQATTTWGTGSVDLRAAAAEQLDGIALLASPACTRHDAGYHSHRRDATTERMAAIAWLDR
jgi:copper oxidase (laccase) domain-containing protein